MNPYYSTPTDASRRFEAQQFCLNASKVPFLGHYPLSRHFAVEPISTSTVAKSPQTLPFAMQTVPISRPIFSTLKTKLATGPIDARPMMGSHPGRPNPSGGITILSKQQKSLSSHDLIRINGSIVVGPKEETNETTPEVIACFVALISCASALSEPGQYCHPTGDVSLHSDPTSQR